MKKTIKGCFTQGALAVALLTAGIGSQAWGWGFDVSASSSEANRQGGAGNIQQTGRNSAGRDKYEMGDNGTVSNSNNTNTNSNNKINTNSNNRFYDNSVKDSNNDNRQWNDSRSYSDSRDLSDNRNLSDNRIDGRNLSDNRVDARQVHTTDSHNYTDGRSMIDARQTHDTKYMDIKAGDNSAIVAGNYAPSLGVGKIEMGNFSGSNNQINNSLSGYFGVGNVINSNNVPASK
ncbi:MAG: hypothetical protein HYS22_00050 [Deltaproteobacteria bacterium]|nr:hypothetical protein [Deltaproteobacteria bacterium]